MRQTSPEVQVAAVVHWLRQVPSTQSWPVVQWIEAEQVPAGRGLHRPPWQELLPVQSESAEQPKKQVLFTHQAPWPQSVLKVQVEGVPPSVAEPPPVPPPVAEPPPLPPPVDEPPPLPPPVDEPPPLPPVPVPPPVEEPPPPPAPEPPPVPPSVLMPPPQKPAWQLWPTLQSGFCVHGLMQ